LQPGKGVDLHVVQRGEDALFDVGGWSRRSSRSSSLHLLALAGADAVAGGVTLLREAAGALEEAQVVIALPGDEYPPPGYSRAGRMSSMPGKLAAVELGRHGLELRAVKEAQEAWFR
jgi:hypothetical protein